MSGSLSRGKRGQPQLYDELKTASLYAGLTGTGLRELDRRIHSYDPKLSRSEFLERLGRGLLNPDRLIAVFTSHNQ